MDSASKTQAAKKLRRRLLWATATIATLLVLGIAGTYWAAGQPPRFYREALAVSAANTSQHGDHFERAALALHNAAQHVGRWEISLSADEINGWLATDMPAKFPRLLPAGISDPRVAIDGDMLRIAVHYQRGGVDTVLSIAGEVYLTAQTNEIAIRLDQARAGLVPIPLGRVIQEINDRAERADLNLRWTEVNGLPVALLRLPLDSEKSDRRVVLDRLDTGRGQVLVAGRTETASPSHADGRPVTTADQSDKETRQR